ncbi:hypothetical protein O1L68_13015 [Streptomyces lydicus]|nr:hypothetical protein [Streptomyces lydicus]
MLGIRVEQPDQREIGAGGGGPGRRVGPAQVVRQPRGHHPAAERDPEDAVRAGATAPPVARREHMGAGQHPPGAISTPLPHGRPALAPGAARRATVVRPAWSRSCA